jgi:resuscitation-promoting factor RpfA
MSDQRRPDAAPADPRVDAAWRAASVEEPPASVDAAILAAARAAVRDSASTRPSPPAGDRWWRRWQPLAAAAAVTGLAFVLLQSLPRHEPVPAPSVAPEADAVQPSPSTAVTAPAAPEPLAKARQESASPEQAVGGAAPPAAIAADAAPVAAERPTPPAARAALQGRNEQLSAEGWVSRIVERHAAGDVETAAADLQAFRAAYPAADAHLPEALRAWAATVPAPASP